MLNPRHPKPTYRSWIYLLAGVLLLLMPGIARANCDKTPNEIAADLAATPDAVLHMQRLRQALVECGKSRQINLMVNAEALSAAADARNIRQLAGVWVGDMWLPVAEGLVPAVADVLTIEGTEIRQEVVRWWDPDSAENADRTPDYFVAVASAKLNETLSKGLSVEEFKPSDDRSHYNPYHAFQGSEPARIQHSIIAFMLIDLGKISGVRIVGDRLLLVDQNRRVRSYVRHRPEHVKQGQAFFIAAEISATRHWPCLMRVLGGQTGDDATRKLLRGAAGTAVDLVALQSEMQTSRRQLERAAKGSDDNAALTRAHQEAAEKLAALAGSKQFIAAAQLFSGEEPPAFCLNN